MRLAEKICMSIPGLRRWYYLKRIWNRLDIPAEEWAKLDGTVEDLSEILKEVRALENVMETAASLRHAHGMNTTHSWTDVTGHEHSVEIVLDGSGASDDVMSGYGKQMDNYRKEMITLATDLTRWCAKNAVRVDYPDKAPLHVRVLALRKEAAEIWKELTAARKGKLPREFLKEQLLNNPRRERRRALGGVKSEPVKLEKEARKETPLEQKKEEKRVAARPRTSDAKARKKATQVIVSTFARQNIFVTPVSTHPGITFTRYRVKLDGGQKFEKAFRCDTELAGALAVENVSVTKAPHEENILFIDVPEKEVTPLLFRELPEPENAEEFLIGQDIDGKAVYATLEKMNHMLVAGTTGSGKSTFLNQVLCSLIRQSPAEVKFILTDPKLVEFTPYAKIPHLYRPLVTDVPTAIDAMREAKEEMNNRYLRFAEAGARNLREYNDKASWRLPRLVVVVDEMADLMLTSKGAVEEDIQSIAQKGRAAGVHLILSTQRPVKEVVTGLIKSNIPTRVAFRVASAIDSLVIMDEGGAEKLCGNGDALVKDAKGKVVRLQGAFLSSEDIEQYVKEACEKYATVCEV